MKQLAKLLLYVCLFVILCSAGYDKKLEDYLEVAQSSENLKSYLYTEGAPEGTVQEDSDGYLWSLKGKILYRFNGLEWQNMDRFLGRVDSRKDKHLLVTAHKKIVVAVDDGLQLWRGHGFKKYKLPSDEIIGDWLSQVKNSELIVDNQKVLHFGQRGYSVLDDSGLYFYKANNIPKPQFIYSFSGWFQAYSFERNNLHRFTDSQHRLWSLRSPSTAKIRDEDVLQFKNGLFITCHHKGLRDSLQFLDPEQLQANLEFVPGLQIHCLDDQALISMPGSDSFHYLSMSSRKISKIPLYKDSRLLGVQESKPRNSLYLTFTKDKHLYLRIYMVRNGKLICIRENQMTMDRTFDQYKGVLVLHEDDILKIKLDEQWSNNDGDYYFNDITLYNQRITNSRFFQDPDNARGATVMHSGNILAVFKQESSSPIMKISLMDLKLTTRTTYRIPIPDYINASIPYSNQYYALIRGRGRLWQLPLQKQIEPVAVDTLFPDLNPASFMGIEQRNPLVISASILNPPAYSLYKQTSSEGFTHIASLPGSCRPIGFRNNYWYYLRQNQQNRGVYALPMEKGKDVLISSLHGIRKVWISGSELFLAYQDSLCVYEGIQKVAHLNSGVLADSLTSWFANDADALSAFYEQSQMVYQDGFLWHSAQSYKIAHPKQNLTYKVPSFSYHSQSQSLKVHSDVLYLKELDGGIWGFIRNEDGGINLRLIGKREEALPEALSIDPQSQQLDMYPGQESPIINLGDKIWYRYSKKWESFSSANALDQIGNLQEVFYHRNNIWLVGYKGLYCYSPVSKMSFIYRESDGLPGSVNRAWGLGSRVIVQGWDDYREVSELISINEVSSGIWISIPWFEAGALRYHRNSEYHLKYWQNNLRIPINILNVDNPETCRIRYRLYGYDKQDQSASYTPYLEYRKLKPGNYRLDITAYSPSGYYSEAKGIIRFRIKAPLWANTYAYILYLLLIIGSIQALFRYRTKNLAAQKQHLEDVVESRTFELKEKQKSITQSMEYASLIQSSILPPDSELQDVLPQHFVVFKPRDIVSGDFYWIHREKDQFYLALVDCTGHGVPGALLSITVNSILNSLVRDRGITELDRILTLAHQEIGKLLHQQSSNNQQDGFEIAMIKIVPERRELSFAGARRPLMVYRDKEMQSLSGDRYAIGGLKWRQNVEFSSTLLTYSPGTRLYMFSDGIVDQPHPSYQRKLGSLRWQDFLTENAALPMPQQAHAIESLLNLMLEYSDQRDDITILGLGLR
jgi:serine phosphatase RsbU (regulator of sigma subunit)